MKFGFLFFFFLLSLSLLAQTIDVQHYKFEVELSDQSDEIKGKATISILFLEDTKAFSLHFYSPQKGKGMRVTSVTANGRQQTTKQQQDSLMITLTMPAKKEEVQILEISYSGIPLDGLIIAKNKYGDRTFFADNWPNRAAYWIPCHDTPADKATVEFIVTAPSHYQVISNGIKLKETAVSAAKTQTHWLEKVPLPTKVMVIGAAPFAVKQWDSIGSVPVSAWVYPQDEQKGFYDYAQALPILTFFTQYIAPFPFEKLANVESKTIFGGMENASAIFYNESSVTGNRKSEDLMAHEIAHQWFGDMATEKSFAHLWLSEGFATYMTDLYLEHQYGREVMDRRLQQERQQVIDFAKKTGRPVVDDTTQLMSLLNANSYQKGAWVLHMIRADMGDRLFQQVIQTYYNRYKGSNADTRDFEKVVEDVSGKSWQLFFDQWLYQPGLPKLDITWEYSDNSVSFHILQTGTTLFEFPIEVAVTLEDGQVVVKKYSIKDQITIIRLRLNNKPVQVAIDPHTHLLYESSK